MIKYQSNGLFCGRTEHSRFDVKWKDVGFNVVRKDNKDHIDRAFLPGNLVFRKKSNIMSYWNLLKSEP